MRAARRLIPRGFVVYRRELRQQRLIVRFQNAAYGQEGTWGGAKRWDY
jgi:hypothetical protein